MVSALCSNKLRSLQPSTNHGNAILGLNCCEIKSEYIPFLLLSVVSILTSSKLTFQCDSAASVVFCKLAPIPGEQEHFICIPNNKW